MASGGCDWLLLFISIASAWYIHKSCGGNPDIEEDMAEWCYWLCLWKAFGGPILKLLECCYMNEHPHDTDCVPVSEFFTCFLTDLPLLVLSIAMLRMNVCQGSTPRAKFSDVLRALNINGYVSLLPFIYHLKTPCTKNGPFAAIHTLLAAYVILRSHCIID